LEANNLQISCILKEIEELKNERKEKRLPHETTKKGNERKETSKSNENRSQNLSFKERFLPDKSSIISSV